MKAYSDRHQIVTFRRAVILAIVILLGQLALTLSLQDDWLRSAVIDWLALVENLLAVIALFYAARRSTIHSRRLGIAWGILALAQLSFTFGDLIWAVIEVVLRQQPFPSAADVFYLTYYPLFLVGILYLPATRLERGELLKTLLDMGIVMLAAVLVFWNFLIGPLTVARAEDPFALTFSVAYPAFDLVLFLAILVILYRRWEIQRHSPLLLLAGSAAAQILTDYVYSYQSLAGTYVSGGLLDLGWATGYALAALAGVLQAVTVQPVTESEPRRKPSTGSLYLPYVWLGAVFLMLIWSHDHELPMSFSDLAFGVGGIVGLAVIRQIVAVSENARLYGQLQKELSERKRAQNRLARLNECLLSFGSNPDENVNRLVATCGELMGATCALYNRLQGDFLYSLGQWRTPPDFKPLDNAEGHICYDVIRRGVTTPIVIRDLQHSPYAQTDPNVALYSLRTYVGIAVEWNQVAVGSLCVVYAADVEPSTEDLELMNIIASAIGVEEERKRTSEALRAQKQLFENLVTVARATAERPTLQATLQDVLSVAATLTSAENGDLILLDETGAVTHCIIMHGQEIAELWQGIAARVMDRGLAGWVARHRQAALITDTSTDERWLTVPEVPYTIRSALSVPILNGSALVGVITLVHPQPGHFDDEHFRLMQAAADQMALAVRNAQIFDAQRRMADRQTTLFEVLRTVSRGLEPDAVARRAAEAIASLTGWPDVAIVLPDEERTHWFVHTASGSLSPASGMIRPIGEGVTGRTFRTEQTQVVNDVSTDPDYIVGRPSVRSELAMPLRRGDRVLGVLNMESDRLAAFGDEDVQLAESLAEAVALALDNARLYEAAQRELVERKQVEEALARRAQELEALYKTSLEINAQPDLSTLLRAIVERAAGLLGARIGALYLTTLDGQSIRLIVSHNLPGDHVGTTLRLGEGISGRIAQTGKPMMIEDYRNWEGRALVYDNDPFRRVLGVPLKLGDKVIGVINVTDDERTGLFSEDEVRLVSLFADQAAIAIANARLYEEASRLRAFNESIVQNMEEGILLEDETGHITFVNPRTAELLGYTAEEMIDRHWTAIVPPEDVARVEGEAAQRPRDIVSRYETVLLTRESRRVPVIVSARPLFEGGRFTGVLSVFTDITERKHAEEALQESEARYRAIIEDQTELICRWRPDGTLIFVNHAYCRYFGKTREELTGHSFMPFIPEGDRAIVQAQITLLSPENPVSTIEHRAIIPDGTIRWQQWTDRLVCDEQGHPIEFQSVGRDITERRQAEERLLYLSTHDALTGLYNRAYFEEELARIERGRRFPVSIVMGDVDGLKTVNDTLGHPAGDQLLRRAAQVLKSGFRAEDVIARIGGDEFAILLPEADVSAARQALTRLRSKVELHNQDHREFPLGFSLGVATADKGYSLAEVLKEADRHMYRDKFSKSNNGQRVSSVE